MVPCAPNIVHPHGDRGEVVAPEDLDHVRARRLREVRGRSEGHGVVALRGPGVGRERKSKVRVRAAQVLWNGNVMVPEGSSLAAVVGKPNFPSHPTFADAFRPAPQALMVGVRKPFRGRKPSPRSCREPVGD